MIVKRLLSLGLSLSMSLSMIGNSALPIFAQEEIEEVEETTTEDPALEEDPVVETIVEEAEPEEEEETIEIEAEPGDQNNPIPLTEGISSMYQLSAGEVLWFYYTIDQNFSKYVVLESLGNDDVKAQLYSMGMFVAESDDDGDGNNFKFEQVGQAGSTYKVKVEAYNSNNDVEFQLKFSMNPYERLTQGATTYSSCWYIVDGTLYVETQGKIPDSHAGGTPWAIYTDLIKRVVIKDGVTEIGAYCFSLLGKLESITLPNSLYIIDENAFLGTTEFETVIYDGYKEDWISITFENENSYPTKYSKTITMSDGTFSTDIVIDQTKSATELFVTEGSNATFKVIPQGELSDYKFKWYYLNEAVSVPNSTSLTVSNVTYNRTYSCVITNIYGKKLEVGCNVNVKKNWSVSGEDVTVDYGEDVNLEVSLINGSDATGLQYKWYEVTQKGRGYITQGPYLTNISIENVTSAKRYVCIVSDADGNNQEAYFNVYVNHIYEVKYLNNEIVVQPGETVDLKLVFLNRDNSASVNQSVIEGSIRWYKDNVEISGEYNTWLHLSNVMYKGTYTCTYTDLFNNVQTATFDVSVEKDWEIEGAFGKEVNGDYGKSLDLTIPFVKKGNATLSYRWLNSSYQTLVENGTETYTIANLDKLQTIRCIVSDQYGNSQLFSFSVKINANWKQEQTQHVTTVKRGEGAYLQLYFNEDVNVSKLTFNWSHDGDTYTGFPLSTYIWDIEKNEYYSCTISDEFGNSQTVSFTFLIEKEWEIDYSGKTYNRDYGENIVEQYVNLNSDVTLSVPFVSGSNTEGLSYTWSDGQYNYSSANPVIRNVQDVHQYTVTVRDVYGNNETFFYFLRLNPKTEVEDVVDQDIQYIFVKEGSTLNLSPVLTPDSGAANLRYKWEYSFTKYGSDLENKTILYSKENQKEYILQNIHEDVLLTCTIKDNYGLKIVKKYQIVVEDELTIDYSRTQRVIYANKGEDVTANVYFLEDIQRKDLTFDWKGRTQLPDGSSFISNDEIEKGRTSITIKNVSESTAVILVVYKNEKVIGYVPIQIRVNTKEQSLLTLKDKTVEYEEDQIQEIDPATVIGSTGNVSYTYYVNEECTSLTSATNGAATLGGAPSQKGVYYVKAHVASDANYNEAYSNVAKLAIQSHLAKSYIQGTRLTLSSDITLNYYVEVAKDMLENPGSYMEFTVGNKVTKVYVKDTVTAEENGVLCHVFPCKLSAKDLMTQIVSKMYYANGKLDIQATYSVNTYANYIYANYDASSRVYQVTQTLMTYGYYAQKYFNYNTNYLPTNVSDITELSVGTYNYYCSDKNSSIDFVGAKLVLGTKPGLKLYFTGSASFKVDGQSVNTTKEGDYTVISISNIDDIYHSYSVTATKFTLKYSVADYLSKGNSLASTKPSLANLCKAMKAYYDLFQI